MRVGILTEVKCQRCEAAKFSRSARCSMVLRSPTKRRLRRGRGSGNAFAKWEGKTDLFSLGQDEVDHPFRMIPKEIALEQQVIRMGGFSGGLHVFVCDVRLG